jgi:hypothetical protein
MSLDLKSLAWFLLADVVLIGVHVLFGLAIAAGVTIPWPDFLHIGKDWSGGEILNYIKWFLVIFALIWAYSERRSPVLLGLAAFFAICLIDDSLQVHERGSLWLVEHTDMYAFFGSDQGIMGELMVWGLLGLVASVGLAIGWVRSDSDQRRLVVPALGLFAGILFCAVVIDVLHHKLTTPGGLTAGLFGMLEDGGEMLFLTLLLAYVRGTFAHAEDSARDNHVPIDTRAVHR